MSSDPAPPPIGGADRPEPPPVYRHGVAPPTQPGAIPEPARGSVWPTVIGVIAIVLGVFSAIGALWGMVSPHIMGAFVSRMPGQSASAMQGFLDRFFVWMIVSQVITLLLAVWLLIGGVAMTVRRTWAANACRGWAVAKGLFVVVQQYFVIQIVEYQFQAMKMSGAPAMAGNLQTITTVSSVVFGLLWGLALPVFMLIWFSRRRIKQEMRSWT
jgi:hypothetical protein